MEKVEIMSPAGDFTSLTAAIQAGADSVFFGVKTLNMRTYAAENFTIKDMEKIAEVCKKNNVKCYLTLNTIIYNNDLALMKKIVKAAKAAGIDAIIACDISTIQYANSVGIEVHTSTQVNVSNIEAVKFFSKYTDVIVLARELTLKHIKQICDAIKKENIKGPSGKPLRIELFCHGALCVSISGKCYMSLATCNKSANCGECMQCCRRRYRVIDEETNEELVLDNQWVMSPKDLCTISFLDKIIKAGVSVLKIEGRARSPEYVYTVTKCYKEAAESVENKNYTKEKISEWIKELETVFNRGFWHGGYYLGKKLGEWSACKGSKATMKKIELGKVMHYFDKKQIAHIDINKPGIKIGEEILIMGPTTGILKTKVTETYKAGKKKTGKVFGKGITLPIPNRVRENDKVFLLVKNC